MFGTPLLINFAFSSCTTARTCFLPLYIPGIYVSISDSFQYTWSVKGLHLPTIEQFYRKAGEDVVFSLPKVKFSAIQTAIKYLSIAVGQIMWVQ